MTVGVNAKVPAALSEAGSAASGTQAGDGEGFAQLLTGATPGTGKAIDGKADPATPGVAAAATAVLQTAAKTIATDGAKASTVVTAESAEAPKGELPAGLSDMVARLVHLDRLFPRGGAKGGKAGEEGKAAKGEGDGSTEKKTDSDTAPTDLSAPLLQPTTPIAAPTVTAAVPAPAAAAPTISTAQADSVITSVGTPTIKAEDAGTAKPLDLSKFTKLAKPVELGQLLGSTPLNDPTGAAAAQPGLAAFMQGVAKAANMTVGEPAQRDAADTAAPAAMLSGSPLLDAAAPLFQPQAAFADLQAIASTGANGAAMPNMTDLSIDRQLDLAKDGQWVDRLARDIARTAGDEGPLRFRLNPETLGSLHVEVSHTHAGAAIRLTADTEAARSILADAQPRLLAEARAQGVRIAEAHVGMNSNGQQADQRRPDGGRPDGFIRTALNSEPDAEQTEQRASAAAERFA